MRGRPRRRGRGGKGGHEPQSRVRVRELQVMEAMLQGYTQQQIATRVGLSQPAVCKILRRLEDRWQADVAWKVDRQRARHTARLEFLYREALQAWQTSKQEALRRRQRKTEDGAGGAATIAEIVSENRHGDPRYLDEARKALADLRKLWGVDAPAQLAIEAQTRFASMPDAAVEAEVARQWRLLQPSDPSSSTPDVVDTPRDDHAS